jgi:hypothetical protein
MAALTSSGFSIGVIKQQLLRDRPAHAEAARHRLEGADRIDEIRDRGRIVRHPVAGAPAAATMARLVERDLPVSELVHAASRQSTLAHPSGAAKRQTPLASDPRADPSRTRCLNAVRRPHIATESMGEEPACSSCMRNADDLTRAVVKVVDRGLIFKP